jgi:dihydropteroate synthase
VIMGILNVTPDSFSDGGRWDTVERAVERGLELVAEGADIVDVGGESTRPGADRVPEHVEIGRVIPVISELAARGVRVSVDTMSAVVAGRAVSAGAWMVNDVSGGLADPAMLATVANLGVPVVLMHWRGQSVAMNLLAVYNDVVSDVVRELTIRRDAALQAGILPSAIVLDPGIGFAKTADHNWKLLARLGELQAIGHPILIGASRKRFLGSLLTDADGVDRPSDDRDDATTAVTALVASCGAWGVRVHEPRASVDAVEVAAAIAASTLTSLLRHGS